MTEKKESRTKGKSAAYLTAHLEYLRKEALPKCANVPDEVDRERSLASIAEAIANAEDDLARATAEGRVGKKPEPVNQIIEAPALESRIVVVRGRGRPPKAKDPKPRIDDSELLAVMQRMAAERGLAGEVAKKAGRKLARDALLEVHGPGKLANLEAHIRRLDGKWRKRFLSD